MKQRVVIIDYQMGNLFSVEKQIRKLGKEVLVTSDRREIENADKLILPGVGHFGKAMEIFQNTGLITTLNEAVLVQKKPILGICLGMQLFAKYSEEGNANGLGWIDGEVKHFQIQNTVINKVPHTGWDEVVQEKSSPLMHEITSPSLFYFVHSYYFQCNHQTDVLATTTHESPFVSAVQKDNVFGVQFHPEKSLDNGFQLLRNFLEEI